MSKYREIKTEFRSGSSLLKALEDLGVSFECIDPKVNDAVLTTHWAGVYGGVDTQVAIAIQKAGANRSGIGNMDGLGFRWNGHGYDLVQDHYDEDNVDVVRKLNQLRQRYGLYEVRRQAKMNGYSVQEIAQKDGSIRLVCRRR